MKGREREEVGRGAGAPHMACLRHAHGSPCQYRLAAAEKRPLSYQTPQSVHMVGNCGAQTLPLTMHYGQKIGGKYGKGMVGF